MRVKYNAAGSDIIPQKAFWFALPLLIKVKLVGILNAKLHDDINLHLQDGVLFTFSPCVSACKGRGYDRA